MVCSKQVIPHCIKEGFQHLHRRDGPTGRRRSYHLIIYGFRRITRSTNN